MRLFQLMLLSSAAFQYSSGLSSPAIITRYEVCLSPGCLADGAKETLKKMQSLAPPGSLVVPGVCCSLCGNGPIVMVPNEKTTTKHRRVKNQQKILDLLLTANSSKTTIPEDLIQGYEFSRQAEEALQEKDYVQAAALYETAIEKGFRSAKDLQAAREKSGCDNVDDRGIPVGLLWLIQARRNEAVAKMETGDLEGAVLAAQAACNIARNKCAVSLEVLAEVYQKEGNTEGELQALNNLFDLPLNMKDMTMQIANKRRELGFRKDKLEALLEG